MNSYLQNNTSISSAAFAAVGLDFPGLNTNLPPLPHMPLPLSVCNCKVSIFILFLNNLIFYAIFSSYYT